MIQASAGSELARDSSRARIYNFSAGPAVLPVPVMRQAQEELLDYDGSGLSILETVHRGKTFADIVARTEARLRELLAVPESHAILFLQGGASLQFAMLTLNLSRPGEPLAYADTGHWSARAIAAARELRSVNVAASARENGYTEAPAQEAWQPFADAAYVHITPNETIDGLEFDYLPETAGRPLVADLSSTILSRPLDVSRYGVLYAGAQKNLGPTGLTLVIIRRELAASAGVEVPAILRYRTHIEAGSLYNTPPTFNWYLIGLYLDWVADEGGLEEMARRAEARSTIVYDAIDRSEGFYVNPVAPGSRSRTNIPFGIEDGELEKRFLKEADGAGLKQLEGHRSKGGMRASLYNAMPLAGAETLADFMHDFALRHG
ncbi:MAG: 3-phosphoserine/phosphohydroxythreonine transaminase [Gammaproteobacteria bacterium]|nr:3-phosphoserine/phosphohydroxythreonine transaminase [Gammaproteobacteria bacterium]